MDINLSISAAPGITTDYLIVAVYAATAPGTLVQSQGFAAPHTAARNIEFTDLDPVPHQVFIYQNATNTAGGVIRHNFLYDPSYQSAKTREDLVLTAGSTVDDPVVGTNSFTRTDLAGWSYDIERRGFGTMIEGLDVVTNTSHTTFTLQGTDVFAASEIFILHFQPQIITITPTQSPSAGVLFTQLVTVTADLTLDAAAVGKCYSLQGAGDHLTVTLPPLSGIPDNKLISFLSDGGSHITAILKAAGTDSLSFLNNVGTQAFLCQGDRLSLFKSGGRWNVYQPFGLFAQVGEIVHDMRTGKLNTTFGNGGLRSRLAYARLWDEVQKLDASELVSDTEWNDTSLVGGVPKNNKGKYSTGDGSTTFRVPLLYAPGFLRGVDGTTRKAGTFGAGAVEKHQHDTNSGELDMYGTSGLPVRRRGNYSGAANGKTDLTDTGQDMTGMALATETRPPSTGIYLLIRI